MELCPLMQRASDILAEAAPVWDFELLTMNQWEATDPTAWARERLRYDGFMSRKLTALAYLERELTTLYPPRNLRRMEAQNAIKLHRAAVLERDGYVCGICGENIAEGDVSIDHIIPITRGGGDNIENLQPAHKSCNSRKGNRVSAEALQ